MLYLAQKPEPLTLMPSRAETISFLNRVKTYLLTLWFVGVSFALNYVPAFAQSVEIDLNPEDLDVFFTWFNTMFSVILPIALIGAGLVAGATFAFVVGTMLKKAFQSLTGGV